MQNLTDLSTIRALCEKHGFTLSKGFGQNFLVNPGICPKICGLAQVDESTNVLEIGPGFGTLTQQLALRAKKVVAVEVDERLLAVLDETLADFDNVHVILQDILKTDLAKLLKTEFGDEKVTVCANLPYYITSPIVMKLLEERLAIDCIAVMVQKEAAQRITALPGTREAGAISYAVRYYADARLAFTVKPGSFYPPPKVTSAVMRLDVHPHLPFEQNPVLEKHLFAFIRAAFSQRRKTLVNSACAGLQIEKAKLENALSTAGINPKIRPEQLTLEQYMQLAQILWL